MSCHETLRSKLDGSKRSDAKLIQALNSKLDPKFCK